MNYLFAGYMVVWTILFFYLLYLNRRQREIAVQLESIERRIRE